MPCYTIHALGKTKAAKDGFEPRNTQALRRKVDDGKGLYNADDEEAKIIGKERLTSAREWCKNSNLKVNVLISS